MKEILMANTYHYIVSEFKKKPELDTYSSRVLDLVRCARKSQFHSSYIELVEHTFESIANED